MAITYHAGRRLQGLSTEGISTVTFEDDDFAGWTVQSRASVTAGVLFTPDSNYANAHITHSFKTYAIGEPDDMVLNWDWKFSGLKLPFIIIGSEASAGQASSSNAGGYGNPTEGNKKIIIKNNDQTLDLNFRSYKTGGSNFNEDANSSTATTTNGVMYYYQFIKDGYDISVKRYGSIADRTSQTNAQQTVTDTWNAGSTTGGWTDTADLAYIVIGSYGNYQNVGFANAGSNYMYDFKLYSGVTSVATEVQRPTNVQVGSRYEETNTRKMYHYNAQVPNLDYTSFPSDYTGWTKSSNDATKVAFSSNRANLSIGEAYVDARAYGYDIGFDLDGDYCIDFDFTFTNAPFTSSGQAVAFTFGISTTTADVGGEDPTMNSEQTKISGYTSGSYTYIYARAKSSAGTNASGEQNNNTAFLLNSSSTQLRYGRLSRSGTTFRVQFFSDSTRQTEVANYSVTTTAQTVRYLYLKSYSQNSGQAWASYLDNIKIYKDSIVPLTGNAWKEQGT